jgi:hypothetical protein
MLREKGEYVRINVSQCQALETRTVLGLDIRSHVEAMWWVISGLPDEWETGGTTFRQGE